MKKFIYYVVLSIVFGILTGSCMSCIDNNLPERGHSPNHVERDSSVKKHVERPQPYSGVSRGASTGNNPEDRIRVVNSPSMKFKNKQPNNYQYKYPVVAKEWLRMMKEARLAKIVLSGTVEEQVGFNSQSIQALYDPEYCPTPLARNLDKQIDILLNNISRMWALNPEVVESYCAGKQTDWSNSIININKK